MQLINFCQDAYGASKVLKLSIIFASHNKLSYYDDDALVNSESCITAAGV